MLVYNTVQRQECSPACNLAQKVSCDSYKIEAACIQQSCRSCCVVSDGEAPHLKRVVCVLDSMCELVMLCVRGPTWTMQAAETFLMAFTQASPFP